MDGLKRILAERQLILNITDVDLQFICGLCNQILDDAVFIKCISCSFCRSCITEYLLDKGPQTCPKCTSSELNELSDVKENTQLNARLLLIPLSCPVCDEAFKINYLTNHIANEHQEQVEQVNMDSNMDSNMDFLNEFNDIKSSVMLTSEGLNNLLAHQKVNQAENVTMLHDLHSKFERELLSLQEEQKKQKNMLSEVKSMLEKIVAQVPVREDLRPFNSISEFPCRATIRKESKDLSNNSLAEKQEVIPLNDIQNEYINDIELKNYKFQFYVLRNIKETDLMIAIKLCETNVKNLNWPLDYKMKLSIFNYNYDEIQHKIFGHRQSDRKYDYYKPIGGDSNWLIKDSIIRANHNKVVFNDSVTVKFQLFKIE